MNKSVTEEWKENIKQGWQSFNTWLDEHDSASWPAFGVFLFVITLGMILNYNGFKVVFGSLASLAISGLFESAIVAWKFTSNRKRNDAKQNQWAEWATWLSVILSVFMIIVNMFRIGGDQYFNTLAYGTVGAAAVVQVVFYILYDNANPDKALTREHNQNDRSITRKEQRAKFTIGETQADLKIIRYIANELRNLQNEFSDLPTHQLETILENARIKLLSEYTKGKQRDEVDAATKGLSDINQDGKIGGGLSTDNESGF